MSILQNAGWKELFSDRHIGPNVKEQKQMLSFLGYENLEKLASDAIPEPIKLHKNLNLEGELSEAEALRKLKKIASKNLLYKSWIGMGYGNTITPAVIQRNVLENPGWYTQYTPYQPEISQGRLESLLNFQTMISDLTALPVANASLLDEATAASEAMLLSHHVKNGDGSKAYFISSQCHPQTIDVVKGRAEAQGIDVIVGDISKFKFDLAIFGILLPYPTLDGGIPNYEESIKAAHGADALVTLTADIMALVLLKPPGELGADIAVGNSQKFGVPLGYGGPHAGFFATKEEYKRKIPGRIVGVSKDKDGQRALRLALQTREQHIRREKATSNICTAQALLANIAAMYAVYHGEKGLKSIAKRIHAMSSILATGLTKLGHKLKYEKFFDTVFVELSNEETIKIRKKALKNKINLRTCSTGGVSISFDETTTLKDVSDILVVFSDDKNFEFDPSSLESSFVERLPSFAIRTSSYLSHPNFNKYHSETKLMRYIKFLEERDLSLTNSMIPLGSCTMKLNAASELMPISWPEFSSIHPFVPKDQVEGYHELLTELEQMLAEVTGFDAVSLQPNSGAQGEYAGLLVIKAYHHKQGESHRNICLIPKSAHGTNPASAKLAGFKVVAVNCDSKGDVDLSDLELKAEKHKNDLAAIMITYPSTHGVFEESIKNVCQMIHDRGGQVYLDGANLNAQLGLCAPGLYGADVSHINLHKTFAIPHGGGGPGMGPIAVKSHLASFLPSHPLVKVGGNEGILPVSAAPFGSAGILPISWMYMKMLGPSGLKKSTQVAILNANYIAKKLSHAYAVLFKGSKGLVAHECIIDLRPFKQTAGIEVVDVAKRLMDYGFHSPTMAFPVPGTLMIEPTESESLDEIDRFCDAMLTIRQEIASIENGEFDIKSNPLKNAPHTLEKSIATHWDYPYSREKAIFPVKMSQRNKFWPSVSRIDEAFGDRNLICTCGNIEDYEN